MRIYACESWVILVMHGGSGDICGTGLLVVSRDTSVQLCGAWRFVRVLVGGLKC